MKNIEELRKAYEEVAAERDQLIKQAEAAKQEFLEAKQEEAARKIQDLSHDQKQFILSLLSHDCSSCSDDNVFNGRWTTRDGSGWRCRKCMLIEMFNGEHEGEFDFYFDVNIHKVTV